MLDLNYVVMYRSRSCGHPEPARDHLYAKRTVHSHLQQRRSKTLRRANTGADAVPRRRAPFEFRELVFNGRDLPVASQTQPGVWSVPVALARGCDPRPSGTVQHVDRGLRSDNGQIKTKPMLEDKKYRLRPTDMEALEEQAQEFELFKNYINGVAPSHPRYKHLSASIKSPYCAYRAPRYIEFTRIVRLMMAESSIFDTYEVLS